MRTMNPLWGLQRPERWRTGGNLDPERRFYPVSEQPTTEVALKSTLKEDLYLVLAGFSDDNSKAIVHAFVNPLVTWVWLGGAFCFGGTVICLIPSKHTRRTEKLSVKSEVQVYAKAENIDTKS